MSSSDPADMYHLPQAIFASDQQPSERIILHDYSAPVGSFRGKSILHRHAISLVITGSGEKTMHFAEKTVRVRDDEFHFLSASNCLVSMNLPSRHVFRSILIFFDNQVLSDFYLKYDELIRCRRGKQRIAPEPYISFPKDPFTRHYIESLKLLTQSGTPISAEMKQLKFEELMLHLLENYPATLLAFQATRPAESEDFRIRKAVETNLVNHVSVEELAFLCHMSLSTFKRRFIRLYGTSPNKWMLQRRMELAKDLLLHYREKPSEVYHKVGYENHSSFTQSFKQWTGMTPKDFQSKQMNVDQQLLNRQP